MKWYSILIILLVVACTSDTLQDAHHTVNWSERSLSHSDSTWSEGATYLSVYSEIYSQAEKRTHKLTSTISLRNPNAKERVFISKVDYYNTEGDLLKSFVENKIYIEPMETIEIILDNDTYAGGTGGNFIFHWEKSPSSNSPLFEAVMISTSGQQGISFLTQGVNIQ